MVELSMPYFRVTQQEGEPPTFLLEVFSNGKIIATSRPLRRDLITRIREIYTRGLVHAEVLLEKVYPMPTEFPGPEEPRLLQAEMPAEALPSAPNSADGLGDGADRAERPGSGSGPVRNPVGRPGKPHKPKNKGERK